MNTEEDKKPFKLVIVGRGEDLSPRMKIRVAILLGEYPNMEITYKDVSRPEDWVDERAEGWVVWEEESHISGEIWESTKPYYRQKERY